MAESYIQSALNELQSALNDIQQQIDGLQRQTQQERDQLQHDLNNLDNTRKQDEVVMTQADSDSQKHVVYDHLRHVHHEQDNKKQRLGQLDQELAPLVQRKTQIYRDLQNLFQRLNQFMASPDIR
jgi:chromosome segregation ATPase